MNHKEYIDGIIKELEDEGVTVDTIKCNKHDNTNDYEDTVIHRLEDVNGQKFSDEQLTILKSRGSSCILACAGSGKTFSSVNLIVKRILTGEIYDTSKLIYTTFSKGGADEMRTRINDVLRRLDCKKEVQVRTLHSFFLSILKTFGVTAEPISNAVRSSMVKQACKDAGYVLKNDELLLIDNMLSFQVNNLMSDDELLESPANTLEELNVDTYKLIRKGYAAQKSKKGVIDYDDMQSYLYAWIVKWADSENDRERGIAKAVKDYCKAMYNNFYIDEAQDVSKLQFKIIRAMIESDKCGVLDKELVFIGDDDQCIYTWRGSDSSIILTLSSEFNIPSYVLSTNYRCKEAILKYASAGIKFNNGRFDKEMKSSKLGGGVRIAISEKKDLSAVSTIAINQIKKWIESGVKAEDIAVLSRNNFHQAILNNMLLREGIYTNSTNDMKFTTSYIYEDMKDILNLTIDNWNFRATAKMLWRFVRFFGANNAVALSKIQESLGFSFRQIVGYCVKNFIDNSVEFTDNVKVHDKAAEKLEDLIKRLSSDSRGDFKAIYEVVTSENELDRVWGLMNLYRNGTKFMYKSEDKTRTLNGFLNYFYMMVKSDGLDKTFDFLRVAEQLEHGSMVIPGGKVDLTTIHGAKGKQWEKVIMLACDNISQPSFDGIVKMINDGIAVRDISENISEERRLFYVGNTRAIDELFVITYEEPSVFILEAMGLLENTVHNNYDIIEKAQIKGWFEEHKQKFITEVGSKYNAEV
jgi:ATP-dependent DNA helicase pcrA